MDQSILLTLNKTADWPLIGSLWWVIDQPWSMVVLVVFALAWAAQYRKWSHLPPVLLAVVLSDVLSSRVLKPLIQRDRPCLDYSALIYAPFGCGSGYSMPSSHAANAFAFAAAIGAPWAYALAAVIAVSRVGIAVHYPSDVVVGAVLGIGCGLAARFLAMQVARLIDRAKATAKNRVKR